jgi:multimeric flavodoxin WrbA
LTKALEGAASQGAETGLIHLYDLNYKGCISCFACKRKGGKSYGKCAAKDGLTPILARVEEADALILGSPNYLGYPTGMMKAFLERLVFQYLVYDSNFTSLLKKRMPVGFIYTMNAPADWMKALGYDQTIKSIEDMMRLYFGSAESLLVCDTYQFDDYSKYVAPRFDAVAKAGTREKQFPVDCKKAFDMGVRISQKVTEMTVK